MISIIKHILKKVDYPPVLFEYPCVDPNTSFFSGKHIVIFGNSNTLGKQITEMCRSKGAIIHDTIDKDIDILIINTPMLKNDAMEQTEEAYFNTLSHYIKPAQEALSSMLNNNRNVKFRGGQIVFVLPPFATVPSVEYIQMAGFAIVGLLKGLALQYASKGIVVNGIVLGDKEEYAAIAEWVVFLASGNARNVIGELVVLD